jgi:hypothetical protein
MSILTGIALGLFFRSIVKSGGDLLLNGGQSLISLFKQELVTASAEEMPGIIKDAINKLNLKPGTRERLLKSGSVIDLAGIAWSEILSEQPDELVSECTEFTTARDLARRLNPYWFIETIMSPRAAELAFTLEAKAPPDRFEKDFSAKLASLVSLEIKDELQLDDETNPQPLVEKITSRMPERIYELWISIPGIEARITRLNTEETLKYVSGSADKDDMLRALQAIAQQLIDSLNEDVFGRKTAQVGEPPLLMHKLTYVEPEALLRRARANEKSSERGAVQGLIRKLWSSEPKAQLVVLHAPFGYGKSLTFKDFAATLAIDWKKAPDDNPFPVLLRCPEVLSGHVSTLKAAVQYSLEKQTGLALSAVERIWSTRKLVLLLDSFDEVHMSEKEAKGWVEEMQQIANGERVRVVVASRPHAFKSKWLSASDWELEVQPFDEPRGQQWLNAVAGLLGPKNLTFREVSSTLDAALAGTPILLLMAAYGWSENSTTKPTSKAAIYRRFIEKISTGKWAGIQEAHQVVLHGMDVLNEVAGPTAFRKALRLLAWEYLRAEQRDLDERGPVGLSRRQVSDTLQANFTGIGDEQVDAITHSLCLSLFFHKSAGTESVVFTHRSFREYLCAEHVIDILRDKRTGPHYLSPAWRLLAEAELGEADLAFSRELLQEVDAQERVRIAKHLDGWAREGRSIFFKGKNGLQIEKSDLDIEIGLAPLTADRGPSFRLNAETLSMAARNLSLHKIVDDLGFVPRQLDRTDLYLLDDDEHRILDTYIQRGSDRFWGLGYHVETGNGVLISPIDDLENYREHLRKAPDVFAPITHVSKDYFTCSVPHLRVEHLHHGFTIYRLERLLDLGELLAKAEAAGVSAPHFALMRPIQTSTGMFLGFCSDDKINLKSWWTYRVAALLVDVLTAGVYAHRSNLAVGQELAMNIYERLEAFVVPSARSWAELIADFESIAKTLRDFRERNSVEDEGERE